MTSSQNILLFFSALLTGLITGLMYGYQCSVIGGLGNLSDKEYLLAFQSINRAILNPMFFISFMGTLVILPIAAWSNHSVGNNVTFYFLVAAAIVYAVGVFGTTMAGNVPLNESLDAFDISSATDTMLSQKRILFEKPWNTFHSIRTYACIITFALSILSIITKKISL